MIKSEREISKEDYNTLLESGNDEITKFVSNIAYSSEWNPCGYGFWKPEIYNKENRYYCSWQHSDSCD